jgi:hypothetical protein
MAELFIGAGAAGVFLLLLRYTKGQGFAVKGWGWGLTLLCLLYSVFVLEVVVEFLREGTPKGAVVMGSLMGFVAVVWAVLLKRFVFQRTGDSEGTNAPTTEGARHG